MNRWRRVAVTAALVAIVAACSSAAPASAPPAATPTPSPTAASAAPSVAVTPIPTGKATLTAPSEVPAGEKFEVAWTGPNAPRDYITIVPAGKDKWTDESFFYTTAGTPGELVAPIEAGAYEVRYINAADVTINARRPITVAAFGATVDAPANVQAGSDFEVSWVGPDGPGDYVTIVAAGATRWTNEDYFYTASGSTGTLTAPIAIGAHEIWYVPGQDPAPQARRPITVDPVVVTLDAPASVDAGAEFQITWTGPDGPSDYITIVPAGSPEGAYLTYVYTNTGNPVTLTAPAEAGDYEIRYRSDRVAGVFASRPIVVR